MTGRDSPRGVRRRVFVLVAVVVGGCLVGGALAAPAAAGDNVAVFGFDANTTAVEPGESVAVTVSMESHGAYDDATVRSLALRLDYPAEYLSVERVEGANWFDTAPESAEGTGPSEVDVATSTATNASAGVTRHEQTLSTTETGVTGEAVVATVHLTVAEDADPATVVVDAAESEVRLTSRYPQPVSVSPLAVDVAGGGDRVEPAYPDEPFAEADSAEDETPTAAETGAEAEATDEPASSGATPGFGVGVALASLATVTALVIGLARAGRRR